jgi:hypothetical protein
VELNHASDLGQYMQQELMWIYQSFDDATNPASVLSFSISSYFSTYNRIQVQGAVELPEGGAESYEWSRPIYAAAIDVVIAVN